MKMLLPVDGSDHTRRMLDYVADHPALFGPGHEYTLFTVVPPIPARATHFLDRATIDAHYREQAEQVLGPARERAAALGGAVRAEYAVGHAGDAIAAQARTLGADLIVMGSHGHSALAGMALGSVTQAVLARSTGPVLIVR